MSRRPMTQSADVGCTTETQGPEATIIWGDGADEELARLAKAIGHPVRVRILRLLAAEPGCMCGAIFSEIPLAQSTISQHLRVLREAGLIEGELDLPRICYCAKTDAILRLKQLISTL